MASFGGALLDPFDCFVLPVCNGLLQVTFFFVEMMSIVAGAEASLGTLNSMMPNLSDAGYANSTGGASGVFKYIKSDLHGFGKCLVINIYDEVAYESLWSVVV